jgi:hypothetical protein
MADQKEVRAILRVVDSVVAAVVLKKCLNDYGWQTSAATLAKLE